MQSYPTYFWHGVLYQWCVACFEWYYFECILRTPVELGRGQMVGLWIEMAVLGNETWKRRWKQRSCRCKAWLTHDFLIALTRGTQKLLLTISFSYLESDKTHHASSELGVPLSRARFCNSFTGWLVVADWNDGSNGSNKLAMNFPYPLCMRCKTSAECHQCVCIRLLNSECLKVVLYPVKPTVMQCTCQWQAFIMHPRPAWLWGSR